MTRVQDLLNTGLPYSSIDAETDSTLIVTVYLLKFLDLLSSRIDIRKSGFETEKLCKDYILLCVVNIVFIYFLFRYRDVSLRSITSHFSSNLSENDRRIARFIRNLYNHHIV